MMMMVEEVVQLLLLEVHRRGCCWGEAEVEVELQILLISFRNIRHVAFVSRKRLLKLENLKDEGEGLPYLHLLTVSCVVYVLSMIL